MVQIPIQGMHDGKRTFTVRCDAAEIRGAFDEFIGDVRVEVLLTKFGKRLSLIGSAECDARLTCDYSLQEYTEVIHADFSLTYMLDTDLFLLRKEERNDLVDEVVAIHEEEKEIDISDEVIQELAVRLPLKRIAPEFRDKSLEDFIDKQYLDSDESHTSKSNDNWSALKNINFDNN